MEGNKGRRQISYDIFYAEKADIDEWMKLIDVVQDDFPKNSDIWVTTYREGDTKGEAARILYKKCGFTEGELIEEFDYPCQKFVLHVV